MLKSVMFGVLIACSIRVSAQETLLVEGSAPDLHLVHTVKKGETFYSLARSYGLPPKEIAAKNNLSMEQGLQLGQKVSIPLTKTNFAQGKDVNPSGYRPVYHQVTEKETLYRISTAYNKVAIDNIRQWNNFSGDGVKKDAYLIVGWVKGAGAAGAPPVAQHTPLPPPTTVPEAPAKTTPVTTPPPPSTPPATTTTATTEGLPPVPIVGDAPAPAPVKKPADTPVVKEEVVTKPVAEPKTESFPASNSTVMPTPPDEAFERMYDQQTDGGKDITKEKGPGGWFPSNITDKYYALHKSAPRGTIVKVTNPLNGKAIYAKVLDAIPQLKANAGLIIKLSNGAKEALGISDARFYCELSYEEQ